MTTASALFPASSATPLPHWGVIRAQGEEAAKFLHGQLTQDFALLGDTQARLAAFCSAKGRMQASFVAFKRAADDLLLVLPRDVLPAVLKRLQMFVLRSKVRLSDASAEFGVWGLTAPTDAASWGAAPWALSATDGGHVVSLYPAQGQARALRVAPADAPVPAAEALPLDTWQWLEVMAGIAPVTTPIVEAFVPQMLNYESVDGVNFKKGCYPGQEVVARSQFRGTLKRRAYLLQAEAPLTVGQDVFQAADAEQPCGTVAAAAPNPAGGWNAIASLRTDAAAAGDLHAGAADGQALSLLPLPYPLRDDI